MATSTSFDKNAITRASGGFVSVMYLGNRKSSQDLDHFLDTTQLGNAYQRVRQELECIRLEVARQLSYDTKWANGDVRVFLSLLSDPKSLTRRSVQHNVILFSDQALTIYAVLWHWVLVRKLKRLQMEGQTPENEVME